MNIYDFDDYKKFVNTWVTNQSSRGRGQLRNIAIRLNVHPTLISHVFRGDKNLSQEQAFQLSEYLQLGEKEKSYFISLVDLAKAGTIELQSYHKNKIVDMQTQHFQVDRKIQKHKELSISDAGIFYSDWKYSATRLLTSVSKYQTIEELEKRVSISLQELKNIIDFLIDKGLCKREGNKLVIGTVNTHIPKSSSLSYLHHRNWRLKSLEKLNKIDNSDFYFTSPFSGSEAGKEIIRKILLNAIKEISEVVKDDPSEDIFCINMDLFQL